MNRNRIVMVVAALLLALCAWAGWARWMYRRAPQPRASANLPRPAVPAAAADLAGNEKLLQKPAPEFQLEDVSGNKVSLSSLRGKAVLLNFWATWCGPCRIETPWLIELQRKYAAQGFTVVGVDTEGEDLKPDDKAGLARQRRAVARFVAAEKIPYPVLLGGDGLAEAYGGLDSMPTSFYLDRNGVIVATQMGITGESEIEANIHKALGSTDASH